MAFAGGPVSFQRFFITGDISSNITDATMKRLSANAFGRQPPRPDDTQHGWIGPRHVLDTELEADRITVGPYLHLAIRVDRLKAPANVVKAYIRLEEDTAREASGREFLSKGEQKKAREAAIARAELEAKAGSFRRMSAYPVLIDLAGRSVLVGNLGASVADRVGMLFTDTFGVALEAATPERVAQRLLNATRDTRALEGLARFHLVRPPDGHAETAGDFGGADLNFLGKEFLTWLWFQIDRGDGPLRVRSEDDVVVMIDKSLRLKCDFGLTGVDTINADGPANLPEARAALRYGKQPVKAGLILGGPIGELRLTLDALKLAVSSLVLPENEAEKDRRVQLEQRFEGAFETAALLDAMFELFLRQRIARDWERTLRDMSSWARGEAAERQLRAASA